MYVVNHNTLSDSFRIRIVWFQPKQDSYRISFFKNRIGSDSKKTLSDHLCHAAGVSVAILVFLKPKLVYFAIVWFICLRFGL